jgi:hypothetical protein
MNRILNQFGEQIRAAAQAKVDMPNRHGNPQHTRINARRQLKKMILRESIA